MYPKLYEKRRVAAIRVEPYLAQYARMKFDTDPKKQERLMEIIHEEVQTIIENGPLANDLQKEKESMLKDFQEDLEKNGYWRQSLYMYYMYGENNIRNYKAAVEAITAETVETPAYEPEMSAL